MARLGSDLQEQLEELDRELEVSHRLCPFPCLVSRVSSRVSPYSTMHAHMGHVAAIGGVASIARRMNTYTTHTHMNT